MGTRNYTGSFSSFVSSVEQDHRHFSAAATAAKTLTDRGSRWKTGALETEFESGGLGSGSRRKDESPL